jgi:hypothetical protein
VINFRFHLISLIAVFLALAVGVVMGYGVLGQPTVDTLQSRIDHVEARANRIKSENNELKAENGRLSTAMEDVASFAVESRLQGITAVPIAMRGVDEDKVADTVRLARTASQSASVPGASVPGVVWLEKKWGLDNADDAAQLATIVKTQSTSRTAVRDAAAKALANRLSSGPGTGTRPDLLDELASAKFLSLESIDDQHFDAATLDGRPASGSSRLEYLLIGGTNAAVPADRGTVPLARALVADSAAVIAVDDWQKVDGRPGRGAGLAEILGDEQLQGAVATFDALDRPDGPLTAVLVLGDRGQGVIGHYGYGAGADLQVPKWWPV